MVFHKVGQFKMPIIKKLLYYKNNQFEMKQQKWNELGASEKTKLSLSIFLIVSSVILGFISFLILNEIPGSVIGINGVWMSTALALLGITAYVNTQVVKMRTQLAEKINEIDDVETRINKAETRINSNIDKRMSKVDDLIKDEPEQ
jgi:hypothetical protein